MNPVVKAGTVALTLVLTFGLTGCATLVNGVSQRIPIASTPAGATVNCAGQTHETPCVLKLKRSKDHTVMVSKPGYQPATLQIAHRPTKATFGNIFLGGVIGFLVDAITGANNELVPGSFDVTLASSTKPPSPAPATWRKPERVKPTDEVSLRTE